MSQKRNTYRAPDVKPPLTAGRVAVYVILVLWALISIFPVYWMLTFSLKNNAEIFGENVIGLPKYWVWENYTRALNTGNMPRYFMNSVIVAVATILITLAASVMATYAITRLQWKGAKSMNKFFMLGLTIPIHASIVPLYTTLARLKMLNSYFALIIPYSAFSLAMGILISIGFMGDIPYDLDEAAFLDGCGVWGTFGRVIAPLMMPAVATVALPVGVQALSGQYTTDWGPIGAALSLATVPTLLVYVFLSKQIQGSFIAGAVKG